MKKVLLIGGGGYVGTVLSQHLISNNHKVRVLDNFVYTNENSVISFLGHPNYEIQVGDLGNTGDLKKASEGVDTVIILGGLVGDPITKSYPDQSAQINNIGVKACIDFFDDQPINRLIFISTCSNYGMIGENELADEEHELKPLSLYASAKVEAERHLLSKKGKTDYSATILRFATAFGLSPRMRFDLSVSEFVRDLFFGKELLVYDEHTWRPYCHVRDFARLLEIVITAPNEKVDFEVFNAGGDVNNFTKKMIVDGIINEIPDAKVKYGENGSDPRNYRVSFDKVKNVLGFEPAYTVKDGINELVEALNNGFYGDSLDNKNAYGNYVINYSSK